MKAFGFLSFGHYGHGRGPGDPAARAMLHDAIDIAQGADELTLVRSGLDDIMRGAFQQMMTVWHEDDRVTDLRTAAFIVAIRRIATTYEALGL